MRDEGATGQVSGTTNWTGQDVDQMWLRLANQQTDTHWQHVRGWEKTSELSALHLWRLMQYRESLAEAWPPEKSEASKAYVARLDFLIDTVRGIYDTAVANHQAFKGVTQAIWESRRDLEGIYNEYQTKKQAKQQYDDAVTANKGRPPAGQRPTTDADLEDLNWRARHIMYGLSSELAMAQTQLRKPPVYREDKTSKNENPEGGGSSAAGVMGSSGPPVFSPVVPVTASHTAAPTPAVHAAVPTPPPPGAGPILGSTGTITPPPVPATPPSVMPPPPPTTGPGLSPPTPIPPGLPPGAKPPGLPPGAKPPALTPGYASSSVLPPGGGPNKTGLGPHTGLGMRVMPPGGMIGGAPGAGLSQPGAGAGAARRINPVGGVIGGSGGAGAAPLSGAGQRQSAGMSRVTSSNGQTFGMGPGARAGQNRAEQNTQSWDPDNPWETDEGVAPVVMPARESGRIDPGPAIGYKR